MSELVRRAGRGLRADGSVITWSVAEGRQGRRWRSIGTHDGRLGHSLLLEVDIGGRPSRIELATPVGLLTLHPDADGQAAHGNIVSDTGVRPLAFDWSPQHEVLIPFEETTTAVAFEHLARTVGTGARVQIPILMIEVPHLAVISRSWRVERLSSGKWTIVDGAVTDIEIVHESRSDGMPALRGAETWPLETE